MACAGVETCGGLVPTGACSKQTAKDEIVSGCSIVPCGVHVRARLVADLFVSGGAAEHHARGSGHALGETREHGGGGDTASG